MYSIIRVAMTILLLFVFSFSASAQNAPASQPKPTNTTTVPLQPAATAAPASTTPAPISKEEEKKLKLEKFEKESDKKKAEWIDKTMEFGIQKDRRDAINLIPTVKDETLKAALGAKLVTLMDTESDVTVLVKMISIAAEMKLKTGLPSIAKFLGHESEDVRIASVYAIKDMEGLEYKQTLTDLLQKQDLTTDSNFIEAIIQTLSDFKAVEIAQFAIDKIKDNKTARNIRLSLVLFIGRSGAVAGKDPLLAIFKDQDEDTDIRSYAVNSLARLDAKDTIPEINKILDEINTYPFSKKKQYNSLQIYCVSALVKLGDTSAYPRLVDAMKSDNASTRLHAIKLLSEIKDKRSIDMLKYKMQYDPSVQVQRAAREALKAMGVDTGTDATIKTDETKSADETPAAAPADETIKKRDDF